jgi:DNA primase
MHVTQKSYFEASRFVDSAKVETSIVDNLEKMLEEKEEYTPFDELMIKRLNVQALESPRAIRYYEGRRITVDSINKFSLGYSEKRDMVTIPVTSPDGNMYVGFIGRSVEGKTFIHTPGLPKSKVLFNLHRVKRFDSVYVVESSFDAIRLDQCGVPAIATLGVYISKVQLDLLTKYFNNVIVIPDNDDAGKTMTEKIVNRMKERATVIGLPQRFKDIGDMTDEDIFKLTEKMQDPLLAMY